MSAAYHYHGYHWVRERKPVGFFPLRRMKYKSLSPPPPRGETDINQSRIYEHFVFPLIGRKVRKSFSCQKEQMTGNKPFFPGYPRPLVFSRKRKARTGGKNSAKQNLRRAARKKYPASQRAEFYILHSGGGTPIKRGAAGSNFLCCGVMTLFLRRATCYED